MKISVLAGVALLALSACHSSDEFSTDTARAEQASEAADAAARSKALNEAVKADADSHEEVQDYRLSRLDNEMAVDSAANADARLDALEDDLTNLKTEMMEVKAGMAAQKTPEIVAPITAKPASVEASKKASKPDSQHSTGAPAKSKHVPNTRQNSSGPPQRERAPKAASPGTIAPIATIG